MTQKTESQSEPTRPPALRHSIAQAEMARRVEATMGRYAVKCGDCYREMRRTDGVGESAAGGVCDPCVAARQATLATIARKPRRPTPQVEALPGMTPLGFRCQGGR